MAGVSNQSCPYKLMPDTSYWRKSVAQTDFRTTDPVLDVPFKIARTDLVATAGSCFAQHIARHLREGGFNYFVAEPAPKSLHPEVVARYNYGTFSARFGNIYTTRQLRQLVDRATGLFHPAEPFWVEDGAVVDPFRPQIQPGGFASMHEAELDRSSHLRAVQRMLHSMDIFVFTLGLTETWESTTDGAVFPVCPGCSGGTFDPSRYRFLNLSYEDVRDDLRYVIDRIRNVNPECRFIFTLSPVPLIATAERKHVLASTTYSKSVLRAAAEKVVDETQGAVYFPSYEIISGTQTRGQYFEDDLRGVREEGVQHVMDVFFSHLSNDGAVREKRMDDAREAVFTSKSVDLVCDEEILDNIPLWSAR